MSVGRGNRRTRKIHAHKPRSADTRDRHAMTMCGLPQFRRYVRIDNGATWVVNCNDCLRALVDATRYK